jgi:hypothetical protein
MTSIENSLRERATARTRIVPEARAFDTTRPRAPSFLRLQKAVGPGGVLPAGVAGLAPLAKRPHHALRRRR